jgi:GT2 family glycosyltransferase
MCGDPAGSFGLPPCSAERMHKVFWWKFNFESGVSFSMIKDNEKGKKLLESVETFSDATVQLFQMISDRTAAMNQFAETMRLLLNSMQNSLDDLHTEEPALMSHLICKNMLYSLDHLMALAQEDSEAACQKIRFELLPMVNELYTDLYFWGLCYPDKKKIWHYYEDKMQELCPLPVSEKSGYKYDVSVVVIAYNKLEYTKQCMRYYEKYFPKNINHELILFNHGSNDGTKEYFESFHPDKQIDYQNNVKSWSIISRVTEGKYILTISNDVLILPHAVENLLKCIESDENICCVAPSCPNISNLQTIPVSYQDEQGMIECAEKNNVSDPYRWEQRARVVPPLLLGRSDSPAVHTFYAYRYPALPQRFVAFTDDLMGLVARRSGKKCVLAKDAFVHHFGSVTLSSETHQNNNDGAKFYADCRFEFTKIFDIDPWGTGFCYDMELISSMEYEKSGPVNILGINCGMGDSLLKIKAMLREKMHNTDVKIYNITDMLCYKKDLAGLSDEFQSVVNWNQVKNIFPGVRFAYIIADDVNAKILSKRTMRDFFERVSVGGIFAVKSNRVAFTHERCVRENKTPHWRIYYKG